MKIPRHVSLATTGLFFFAACGQQQPGENAATDESNANAYGFVSPGLEPELFAFDLLGNDAAQVAVAMSPHHDELFYSQLRLDEDGISFDLLRSEYMGGQWTNPESAEFVSEHGEIEAFYNRSGSRLYFFSRRPVTGVAELPSPWNIWFVEKTRGDWGVPQLLGQPDSLVVYNWSATLQNDSTLYFTARPYEEHGLAEIFQVPISGDGLGEPRSIGSGVNTREYTENEPAIAPDGSYIVFYSAGRPDNLSSELLGDLYISFRGADGSWTDATRIDEPINSTAEENWPRISPDGKFLFFSSNRREGIEMSDLYWVSTQALERYRPN